MGIQVAITPAAGNEHLIQDLLRARGETPAPWAQDVPDDEEKPGRHLTLISAAGIKPKRVRWLWDGRFALGTLGILAGREGQGKTTISYTLAAQITRGTLNGEFHNQPRAVIVCATEDSWEHTIIPRLMAADADLKRIYRVEVTNDGLPAGLSLPIDLHDLEIAVAEVGAAMILLDPLTSRLHNKLDTHKDAEVRQALEPLVAFTQRADVFVLGIMHFNKSGSTDPLELVMGSKAFSAVARSVHSVVTDPDDETDQRKLFGTPKNNLGTIQLPSLAFRIVSHPIPTDDGDAWTGRLEWDGETDTTITEAMRQTKDDEDRTATQEAADWLTDYLHNSGGSAASSAAKKAGRGAGHSERTIKRALKIAKVTSKAQGFPRSTWWHLPESAEQSGPRPSDPGPTGPTGPTGTADPVGDICNGPTTTCYGPTDDRHPVGPVGPVGPTSGDAGLARQSTCPQCLGPNTTDRDTAGLTCLNCYRRPA